jgi:hypothetical protein
LIIPAADLSESTTREILGNKSGLPDGSSADSDDIGAVLDGVNTFELRPFCSSKDSNKG